MASRFTRYGLLWPNTIEDVSIEMDMCRMGGTFKKKNGEVVGQGHFFHFKRYLSLLWPEIKWHHWADLQLKCYLENRIIGQIGCASSGKTFVPSACILADYYLFPHCTTCLVSSTTRESLEMRVLGEVKKLHKLAKQRFAWLPGHLIEGRQRIVSDSRNLVSEGRDFRNGLVGVACKRGQSFQGIEEYVGIKNKRLRMLGDELQFLPRVFVDSIANLNKNADFKGVFSGNPKDTTDALGVLCEPASNLGGWDAGLDQMPGAKTWPIRFPKGICIQLPGSDSPNLDGKLGIPLITQEQIDADIAFYGKDSVQFTMMDEGRMPRGISLKRVITRQMCFKHHAMEEPIWSDENRLKIGFLDAAYRGVGGDRCVYGELEIGHEIMQTSAEELATAIISQITKKQSSRQIINLITTDVIPIVDNADEPETQIASWVMNRCQSSGVQPENFFFDSTGRGSLVQAFGRMWSTSVNGIEFGGPASERKVSSQIDILCKDYYFNFVTELWFSVSYVIQSDQFRGLTEDVMSEGCMREWGHVGGMKMQVEPKDKMKIKSGRSPDLFDALACGIEGARRRGFVITMSKVDKPNYHKPTWKRDIRERSERLWRHAELDYAH